MKTGESKHIYVKMRVIIGLSRSGWIKKIMEQANMLILSGIVENAPHSVLALKKKECIIGINPAPGICRALIPIIPTGTKD